MTTFNIENIKALRKKKGFTQSEIARQLKIKVQTYGKIERGEIKLTVERLYQIADLYQLSPSSILEFHSSN